MANEQKSTGGGYFWINTKEVRSRARDCEDIIRTACRKIDSTRTDIANSYAAEGISVSGLQASLEELGNCNRRGTTGGDWAEYTGRLQAIANEYDMAEDDILSWKLPEFPSIRENVPVSSTVLDLPGFIRYKGEIGKRDVKRPKYSPGSGDPKKKEPSQGGGTGKASDKKAEEEEYKVEEEGKYYGKKTITKTRKDKKVEYETTIGFETSSEKVKIDKDKDPTKDAKKKWAYDSQKKKMVKDDKTRNKDRDFTYEEQAVLAEYGVGASVTYTAAGAKAKGEAKYASGSAEVYAVRAEASARAAVGAYVYKDKDDKQVFGVGLLGEAGASFTIAGASAKGEIGDKFYLAGGGGVTVKVGEVKASSSIQLGLIDGLPVGKLEGSVGADALSAKASAKMRVLGVESEASVTLKVGLSAEAQVGFEGGEFKFEAGICVGIGLKIGFSLNFGKLLNEIVDVGEKAWSGVKKFASKIKKFFSSW